MRMFCPPVGFFTKPPSSPGAGIEAGFWTDPAAISNMNAAANSLTPTTFAAREGQAFIVAAHLIGGSTLTGLTVGGVSASLIASSNGGSGSRWASWYIVDTVTAANPVVAWTAGQSSTVVSVIQVTGVNPAALGEAIAYALDTGIDNDTLTVNLGSQAGMVLAFGSRVWNFTAGVTAALSSNPNLCVGGQISASTDPLAISANRTSGSQADRILSAIRLPITGAIGGGSADPSADFSVNSNSQYAPLLFADI